MTVLGSGDIFTYSGPQKVQIRKALVGFTFQNYFLQDMRNLFETC